MGDGGRLADLEADLGCMMARMVSKGKEESQGYRSVEKEFLE